MKILPTDQVPDMQTPRHQADGATTFASDHTATHRRQPQNGKCRLAGSTARGDHARVAAEATQPAEITGFWRGKIGSRERVDSGFELRRAESGELELYLWQPILNMFGFGPAHPSWDGRRLTFEPFALDVTLQGGRLVGTFAGPTSRVSMRRVSSLPGEKPVPRVPSLPAPRWETRPGGQIYASPVLAGERVYLGTTGGTMNAINVVRGLHRMGCPDRQTNPR